MAAASADRFASRCLLHPIPPASPPELCRPRPLCLQRLGLSAAQSGHGDGLSDSGQLGAVGVGVCIVPRSVSATQHAGVIYREFLGPNPGTSLSVNYRIDNRSPTAPRLRYGRAGIRAQPKASCSSPGRSVGEPRRLAITKAFVGSLPRRILALRESSCAVMLRRGIAAAAMVSHHTFQKGP